MMIIIFLDFMMVVDIQYLAYTLKQAQLQHMTIKVCLGMLGVVIYMI